MTKEFETALAELWKLIWTRDVLKDATNLEGKEAAQRVIDKLIISTAETITDIDDKLKRLFWVWNTIENDYDGEDKEAAQKVIDSLIISRTSTIVDNFKED